MATTIIFSIYVTTYERTVAIKITLTNVSVYRASKITLLQWRTASADPSGIMSPKFFREKYLPAVDKYIMVIPARQRCVHAGKTPDGKLKINELGP